jgi:fructose-bisphosphate aldolase class II
MPVKDILSPAFDSRYSVPAINVFTDLTMEAVLAAAVEANSPVILKTSVKTARAMRSRVLFDT